MTTTTRRGLLRIAPGLGLLLASAAVLVGFRSAWWPTPDIKVGSGRAYAILGGLPVKHRDRIKPLQSLAVAEVGRIHGSPSIQLLDPGGHAAKSWEPVAAFLDWSARPEFWDDQDFILVEDRGLRSLLVDASIRAELRSMAGPAAPEVGSLLGSLAARAGLADADLRAAAGRVGEASPTGRRLGRLAARMGARHSWLSPGVLEKTRFSTEGRELTLAEWAGQIRDNQAGGAPELRPIEEGAVRAGERLLAYRSIRDHNFADAKSQDLMLLPRPVDGTYLGYSAEAFRKGLDPGQDLSPIETDAVNTLVEYLETLPSRKWALPGEDGIFDQEFSAWIALHSRWIPAGAVLGSDDDSLSKAGLPDTPVADLRRAYRALEAAQRETPGEIPEALAIDLVASARQARESLQGDSDDANTAHELFYNGLDPFAKAAIAYGSSLALLMLGSGLATGRRTMPGRVRAASRALGLAALATGVAIGISGFVLRFLVMRMVPVATAYETVIFVGLMVAAIGLAAGVLGRREYAATLASGIALAAALLSRDAGLFDPDRQNLLPLERINRWLVGHAVPMLSGYAALALAAGLGLLAVGYALTATHRRAASYRALAWPLLPGVALHVLGRIAMAPDAFHRPWSGPIGLGLAGLGGALSVVGGLSALGEFANRSPRLATQLGLLVAALGVAGLIAGAGGAPPPSLAVALASPYAWIVPASGVLLAILGRLAGPSGEALGRIASIARFNLRIILLGLAMLVVGALVGGAWAQSAWGQPWLTEPKVLWTLATFGIYLVPLLGRGDPFRVVAGSAACFAVLVLSWFGAGTPAGAGRHGFGWMHGEGRTFAISAAVLLPSAVAAAAWRHSRSGCFAIPGGESPRLPGGHRAAIPHDRPAPLPSQ